MKRHVKEWTHPAETIDELLDDAGRPLVLIATAGEEGLPHVTTADRILPQPDGLVEISGWLCATTIRNLKRNSKLALIVRARQGSVQVEGQVDAMEEDAILDGYVPDEEGPPAAPQTRWIVHVRPKRFFRFGNGLHSDEPLGGEVSPASP